MDPRRFVFWLVPLALSAACDNAPKSEGYSAVFADAKGLKPGAVVYIAGVQVGRVNQVDLDGTRARVQFDVRSAPGATITAGTCVSVGFYGLSSDAHLSVEPGAVPAAAIAPGGEISCVNEGALGKSGERALANADKLLNSALSGKGIVSRLLHDKDLADKVERFFDRPAPAPTPAAGEDPPTAPPNVSKPPDDKPKLAPKPTTPKPATKKPPTTELVNPFQ
jgi:hypothetical protein